jgi:hypothetical protein
MVANGGDPGFPELGLSWDGSHSFGCPWLCDAARLLTVTGRAQDLSRSEKGRFVTDIGRGWIMDVRRRFRSCQGNGGLFPIVAGNLADGG